MVLKPRDVFAEHSKIAVDIFESLCNAWKRDAKLIQIIVEGAGDILPRYLPALRRASSRGKARVRITDKTPLRETHLPRVVKNQIARTSHMEFIDKSELQEWHTYKETSADIVFVNVPDEYHLPTARTWLGLAEQASKACCVFVEKPLARSLFDARQFYSELEEKPDSPCMVIPIDHYLAKIWDLIPFRDDYIKYIGGVGEIEFAMVEDRQIKPQRKEAVKRGMIFDMYPHMLALTSLFADIRKVKYDRVGAMRYEDAPIRAETFAYMEFFAKGPSGKGIQVSGSVGKGLSKEEKYMRVVGPKGYIDIDLTKNGGIQLYENDGSPSKIHPLQLDYEFFISTLLSGKYFENPVGALTHELSLQIMWHLFEVSQLGQDEWRGEYSLGDDRKALEEICMRGA